MIDVHLAGSFFGMRAAARAMSEQRSGSIVNTSSVLGVVALGSAAGYTAAKHGVIGLTKSIGKDLATTGVLVNCVAPAVIETPILAQLSDEHVGYMISKIPMGRMGTTDEVANLVLWLASEDCSFSTGATFDISGGRAVY